MDVLLTQVQAKRVKFDFFELLSDNCEKEILFFLVSPRVWLEKWKHSL